MSLACKLALAASGRDGSPADLPNIVAGMSDALLDDAERLIARAVDAGNNHRLTRSTGTGRVVERVTITPAHFALIRDAIRAEESARCGL
jgi:hypothetical protein